MARRTNKTWADQVAHDWPRVHFEVVPLENSIAEAVAPYVARALGLHQLDAVMACCDSEIERVMVGVLLAEWIDVAGRVVVHCGEDSWGFGHRADGSGRYTRIDLQMPIGTYRADLVLRFVEPDGSFAADRLVIECDGHDYHERTKEQAAHDRRRDRDLQREGYMVLRFTGSQIWQAPVACANEVYATVVRLHNLRRS